MQENPLNTGPSLLVPSDVSEAASGDSVQEVGIDLYRISSSQRCKLFNILTSETGMHLRITVIRKHCVIV